MASFDENGKYIKTNWKAGDKITATKLNKIEESIEAVNDNDISRHVEADARLDALEAKDVAHDKEFTNIKNTIADNKAAAELGDYDINSRMTFLENELNEGIEEVHNVAETVDGKIATAEANMTAQVNQGKADMEAMVAEVEADLEGLHAKDEELSEQLAHNMKNTGVIIEDISDVDINTSNLPIRLKANIEIDKPNATVSDLYNIVIDGNNSIINLTNETDSFLKFSNINNLTIKNLKITGLKTSRHSSCYGLLLHNINNFIIENVTIDGGNAAGIFLNNCSDGIVRKCNVLNTLADGIHVTNNSKNIQIINNYVYNTGDDGIAVVSYEKDNGSCQDVKIISNTVINSKCRGISHIGGNNIIIEANFIDTTSSSGILVGTDSNYITFSPQNTILSNNIILNAGRNTPAVGNLFGIELTGCDVVKVKNNIVKNSKTRGIVTTKSTSNVSIIDNTFTGGTLNQVETPSGFIFTGNKVEGFSEHGLYVYNVKNSIVSNNVFKNNATNGSGTSHNLRFGNCTNINATNNACIDDRETILTKRSCEITGSDNIDIKGLISVGSGLGVATSTNIIIDPILKTSNPVSGDTFYKTGTMWVNTISGAVLVYTGASWVTIN